MATVNLINDQIQVDSSLDSIAVPIVTNTIRGGRSLDVSGYPEAVLKAGHVIIRETSDGDFKPMPVTTEGAIQTLGTITPGSGYTGAGSYAGVALTGGTGSGATADIVVAGGVVTSVTIVNPGTGYTDGNALSASNANIGGAGSGFSVPVTVISETAVAYASLPSGHTYAGILRASILTAKPFAAIVTAGQVNPDAGPFSLTSILTALKTAVPLIEFQSDSF